jgi:hypothetical protein
VQAGGVALQAHVKQYLREGNAAAPKVFAAEVVDRNNGTFRVGFDLKHACDFEVRDHYALCCMRLALRQFLEHHNAPLHGGANWVRGIVYRNMAP